MGSLKATTSYGWCANHTPGMMRHHLSRLSPTYISPTDRRQPRVKRGRARLSSLKTATSAHKLELAQACVAIQEEMRTCFLFCDTSGWGTLEGKKLRAALLMTGLCTCSTHVGKLVELLEAEQGGHKITEAVFIACIARQILDESNLRHELHYALEGVCARARIRCKLTQSYSLPRPRRRTPSALLVLSITLSSMLLHVTILDDCHNP